MGQEKYRDEKCNGRKPVPIDSITNVRVGYSRVQTENSMSWENYILVCLLGVFNNVFVKPF
jgi:hypothetical protein